MVLQEENYIQILQSYSKDDWKPLLDLIPEIEQTAEFGEDVYPENGFPFTKYAKVVEDFHRIVYRMPVVINFNWLDWKEGQDMIGELDNHLDKLDLPTICKLLTFIVRADRFGEGFMRICFEKGWVLTLLKRIEIIIE